MRLNVAHGGDWRDDRSVCRTRSRHLALRPMQAITMMHVLLTDEVVQEAATLPNHCAQSVADSGSASGSGSGSASASASASGSGSASGRSGCTSGSNDMSSANLRLDGVLAAPAVRPSMSKSFLRTCLVLVPKNVLRNWQEELQKVTACLR